ncbi:MAG TPA: winged helix-turn-helix domain-containing protein [Sphingomicrobium sp.]|nr:winged helix-turn-helix domain-containing protein [Sphingomicrobium sp.]
MGETLRVDLAHEPDFVLGRLVVCPSRRELLRDDGEREVLEHRMMQVLIALAKARGAIVTRDELVLSCWDGRVVGEDAINRVMSRLRKAAAGIGAGSFTIETVTKIGYRLAGDGIATDRDFVMYHSPPTGGMRPQVGRRYVLAGAATLGVLGVAGGALLHRKLTRPAIPPEVSALLAQAKHLFDQGTQSGVNQAIALRRRVVQLAPSYADGWGILALTYAIASHYGDRAENEAFRARAEAAGRRALELDRENVHGELALAVALPLIGHWQEREQRMLRALRIEPRNSEALFYRAANLQMVGRSIEAVETFERVKLRPLSPVHYTHYVQALWSAGRMEDADRAMEEAASLYATHGGVWFGRFDYLQYSGRAKAAIAMSQDVAGRPTGLPDELLADWLAAARAIDSRDPAEIDAVMAVEMGHARKSAPNAERGMRIANAFGRVNEAYAVADAYYFGRGFTVPNTSRPGSGFSPEQRQTSLLFEPVTRPMRSDPRFGQLVEEIGLERYWRRVRVEPDYRSA